MADSFNDLQRLPQESSMKMLFLSCLAGCLMGGTFVHGLNAQAPRNVGVTFNGETDAVGAAGHGHVAHDHRVIPAMTGTSACSPTRILVIARGGDLLSGLRRGLPPARRTN